MGPHGPLEFNDTMDDASAHNGKHIVGLAGIGDMAEHLRVWFAVEYAMYESWCSNG